MERRSFNELRGSFSSLSDNGDSFLGLVERIRHPLTNGLPLLNALYRVKTCVCVCVREIENYWTHVDFRGKCLHKG